MQPLDGVDSREGGSRHDNGNDNDNNSTSVSPLLPTKATQKELGRQIKRLIDLGRVKYLQQFLGFEAEIVYYCPPEVSPENALLLAWKKN